MHRHDYGLVGRGPFPIVPTIQGIVESKVAVAAARRCCAPCGSRGTSRGRPSLCTSVTVIGLLLAAPNYRKKMEKTADATGMADGAEGYMGPRALQYL
eukprot:scaffold5656_cov155-Isochrysis_galbana.AAC.2